MMQNKMKKQFEGKTKLKKLYMNSSRGIIALLAVCLLLGIAGIGARYCYSRGNYCSHRENHTRIGACEDEELSYLYTRDWLDRITGLE